MPSICRRVGISLVYAAYPGVDSTDVVSSRPANSHEGTAMTTPCAYGNVPASVQDVPSRPASRRTAVGLLWLSIIASLLLGGRVQAQRPRLSNDAQLMVNRSIEDGRRFLLSRQT